MSSIQLHQCGCGRAHHKASAPCVAGAIDMHCHVFAPVANQKAASHSAFAAEQQRFVEEMGVASVEHNRDVMMPSVIGKLVDVQQRLDDMDAEGVAMQCLSPSPSQYFYWADEALSAELVALQNAAIQQLCEQHPKRFVGLGAVSLQHPELAVKQLRELMQQPCFYGVEISTRVNDRDLDAAELLPFWQAAAELGALVFIHPFSTRVDDRLQDGYLSNLIGQPLETTIAVSRLMVGGVLDRFPNLKILTAHGGGYLPQYVGRHNRGAAVRPELAHLARTPSDYLSQLWFDSLVFSPLALRHLIDQVGIERVVLGTDYPFDMGSKAAQEWLSALGQHELETLLIHNPLQLLGLSADSHPHLFSDAFLSESLNRLAVVAADAKEPL